MFNLLNFIKVTPLKGVTFRILLSTPAFYQDQTRSDHRDEKTPPSLVEHQAHL